MNKNILKNIGMYVGIAALFLVLAYGFVPQVLSGKIVNQSDITGFQAMSHEASAWNQANPDQPARWTGSMFGGMPTTSFMPSHEGDWTQPIYDLLLTGKRPATYLFISLLGAFLLMLSLGISPWLAVGGAVAVTFCSYNFQIIQVGHNTKMQALAFLPWVMAAVIFTYKRALKKDSKTRKWLSEALLGAVLFAFALSFQIKANHQQITYYLALMIVIYVAAVFISLLCSKEGRSRMGRFFAASALLLCIGMAGIGTNAIKLMPLYDYTAHTMRGGSELSHPEGGQINSEGLQIDYATAWSYGWEELPNLMIPNFNGGASNGSVNPDKSAVVQLFRDAGQGNLDELASSLPLYWGPQPFTAGPMYMGAITIFLFLLGLFLYKGKDKWWLLAATVLAIFLGLGSNFMWFTRLFFDHVPMYNKFRTVSMALVILQFTLPMLGFLVLDRVLKNEYSKKEFMKAGLWALGLSGGFCLLCALFPGIAGTFTGSADSQMQDIIVQALVEDRRHLLVSDAFVSMVFIALAFVLLWWSYSSPKNAPLTAGGKRSLQAGLGICLLVLVNMFAVGKRYLNSDDFTTPRRFNGQFTARSVDKYILEDPDPSYRVADLTADMFNDSFTPYWHKSVGGYSPAKLQRYQDLIDRYLIDDVRSAASAISKCSTIEEAENSLTDIPVLNALNTKYFIIGAEAGPIQNHGAYGNAWFVDSLVKAAGPDLEIGLVGETDLRHAAIIGEDFPEGIVEAEAALSNGAAGGETETIELTEYTPDRLSYHYAAASDRVAVFSEIYYPGWKAYVDGKETCLFRTDWTLRGAVLPAGEHDIIMKFEPEVYSKASGISRISSVLLLLFLALACAGGYLDSRKEDSTSSPAC